MMNHILHFIRPQDLMDSRSGIVRFGTAPDGLPLLTTVEAPPKAEDLLQRAAWALGADGAAPLRYEGTPLEPVLEALNRVLGEQRIQRLAQTERGPLDVLPLL